MTPFKICHFIS